MSNSLKLRFLRTFSANDWNNPESTHSPSLTIALQINAPSTFSSNAEILRKPAQDRIKQN
jgi:hypothetical protein